jgi:uncharacterized protein (TIGR03435 family)
MNAVSRQLSALLGRDVVDKTEIAGRFDIHLDSFWENLTAAAKATDPPGPADPGDVFAAAKSAVQKLGLHLQPTKGFRDFIVVDAVSKQSEN